MNNDINIHAIENKICSGTAHELLDEYFKSIDIVINGFDSISARKFI